MGIERTLVVIKPDGVEKGLIGEIISRFERKGFKIKALKMLKFTREQAEEFYKVHKGKSFFNDLIEFITSDYALSKSRNIIHASDSPESAEFEISVVFKRDEILD